MKFSIRLKPKAHGYANGDPIPEGYAKLLRLMVKLELKPDEVK